MTKDQRDTEMERDAARYRWLRALKARHNPPVNGSIWCVQRPA